MIVNRGKRHLRVRNPLALGVIAAACAVASNAAAASQVTYTGSVPLPSRVQLWDAALAAADGIQVGGVVSVTGNAASSVSAAGSSGIVAGSSDTFPNIWSVAPVLLASDNVLGSIASAGSVTAANTPVGGTVAQNTAFPLSAGLSLNVTFPSANAQPVSLSNASTTLAPGRYADVSGTGSTLTLTAGTYYFTSLTLDSTSALVADDSAGTVTVYVEQSVSVGGPITTVSTSGGTLFLVAFGAQAQITSSTVEGTLAVPNGTALIGPSATFYGAIFANYMSIGPAVTFNHQPSALFGVPVAPTGPVPIISSQPNPCFAPFMSANFQSTGPGQGTYSSLAYLTPNAASGICAPQFCDDNENPIATPSEAELNSPPPQGSTCPAVAATAGCPVDPATLGNVCATDVDCASGTVCAAHCLDAACANVEHRCGSFPPSCAGLPQADNCKEYRLCAQPGAVGQTNPAQLKAQLTTITSPSASGMVDPTQRTVVKPYDSLATALCTIEPEVPVAIKDGFSKPANDGSQQWGVYLTPISSFNMSPVKSSNGIGELTLSASGGAAFGGIVMGNKVEVLSASVGIDIDDCGITGNGQLKVFGETVATWTPSEAQNFHLVTDNSGDVATSDGARLACTAARKTAKDERAALRHASLFARAVNEYYSQNGFTSALCSDIVRDLPQYAKDPGTGQPLDCTNLSTMPPRGQVNIVNAWKTEYDGHTNNFLNFADLLQTSRMNIQTSGTLKLFDTPHAYHVKIVEASIPIGPIALTLAAEGFGQWNLAGGLQFGFGVDGPSGATNILQNTLNGEAPSVGDLRVFGGPQITPSGAVGVLVFVGVGIPGVSVGVEGQIKLLDIAIPAGIVGAVLRVSEPDTRDVSATDYAGAPIPGLTPVDYRWLTGYTWGANLDLAELDGELDLAVRIDILFFSKTFRSKLFGWNGFQQQFALVGGNSGGPIDYSSDYGKDGNNVAYTVVKAIPDNPPKIGTSSAVGPACSVIQ